MTKKKTNNPVLAICYDFDKTLSPTDMQAQGYIQEVGYDVDDFWKESNKLAEQQEMDDNLAYMYMMINHAVGNFYVKKDILMVMVLRLSYSTVLKIGSKELINMVKSWG